MTRLVLVTGMLRSGTTMVDRLLSSHPAAMVASQPLPSLYTHLARRFLDTEAGAPARSDLLRGYPLGDLFGANYYPVEAFSAFLSSYSLGQMEWRTILRDLRGYSGTMTEVPESIESRWPQGAARTPIEVVESYLDTLDGTAGADLAGSKETICEQFVPYYLACGAEVILILRDVRDVISSLDSGRGEIFAGRRKPLLFNIRQWRKSVAFALEFENHPRVQIVHYEDVVRDPSGVLDRVFQELGLDAADRYDPDDGLRDPVSSSQWHANSSFAPYMKVTEASVGSHKEHLSCRVVRLIEAACFSELTALGYRVEMERPDVEEILGCRWSDHADFRPELGDYCWSERLRDEELDRWRGLRCGRYQPSLHLFRRAFDRLRTALGYGPNDAGGSA